MPGRIMDEAGMTDIPMRLLIAAVLTSLMVPLVWGAYEDLSRSVAEDRAMREMGRIATAARAVLDGDAGSAVELTVDLRGFGQARFEKGTVGGPLLGGRTAEAYLITFMIELVGELSTAPDPPIAMTGPDASSGLELRTGRTDILVTHVIVDGMHAASFATS